LAVLLEGYNDPLCWLHYTRMSKMVQPGNGSYRTNTACVQTVRQV
jgi:hypothetical protein